MTGLQTIKLLIVIFLLSAGQIFFKIGSENLPKGLSLSGMAWAFFSPSLIFAVFIYGIATILWVIILRDVELRLAYPFMALCYIVVPVISHIYLREQLHLNSIIGALIIIIGVLVSTYK